MSASASSNTNGTSSLSSVKAVTLPHFILLLFQTTSLFLFSPVRFKVLLSRPRLSLKYIARFEGTDDTLSNQPAIVGAHQDSINGWNPLWGRSPGADDDGSGTVTILEVFRSLVGTGFRPTRPVEFHWYSAEEAGLLGSQDVAESYEKKGVQVIAMIQVSCPNLGLEGLLSTLCPCMQLAYPAFLTFTLADCLSCRTT